MSSNKKYFWLKLKDDFFKQKEMKKLRKIAGGDTFTIIYLKLMLLSMKTEGILEFSGIEDTFAEELALEIDEDADNVSVTLNFLKKCNLLELIDDKEIFLNKVLEMIGKESESAERVRRLREKLKTKALQCNVDVTKCNTEIEIDKEIDKEQDNKKNKTKKENNKQLRKQQFEDWYNRYGCFDGNKVTAEKHFMKLSDEQVEKVNRYTDYYLTTDKVKTGYIMYPNNFLRTKQYENPIPNNNKETKTEVDTKTIRKIQNIETLLDASNIIYEKDKLFLEDILTDDRYSEYRYMLDKIKKAEIV